MIDIDAILAAAAEAIAEERTGKALADARGIAAAAARWDLRAVRLLDREAVGMSAEPIETTAGPAGIGLSRRPSERPRFAGIVPLPTGQAREGAYGYRFPIEAVLWLQ